jgi:murein DD-endopeptidase MepM/ murein hydrolase activator NlpD
VRIHPRLIAFLIVAVPAAVLSGALLGPIAGRSPSIGDAPVVPGLAGPAAVAAVLPPSSPLPPLGGEALRRRLDEAPAPVPLWALRGYVWPLPHGRLTQPFGPSGGNSFLVDGIETHDGIDLATFCGDRIVAAHDGVVLAAGRDYLSAIGWRGDLAPYRRWLDSHSAWSDLPITVVIDDGDTYRTIYAHFSRILVAVGQHVRAGQLLGYEGRTGHATGCHLHFGVFSPIEPATWTLRGDIMRRYDLPPAETARVDPLVVLPPRLSPPTPGPTVRSEPPGGNQPL